jgi:hypothetical protein
MHCPYDKGETILTWSLKYRMKGSVLMTIVTQLKQNKGIHIEYKARKDICT